MQLKSKLAKEIEKYKDSHSRDHMRVYEVYLSDEMYQQEISFIREFVTGTFRHEEMGAEVLPFDKFKYVENGIHDYLIGDGYVAITDKPNLG